VGPHAVGLGGDRKGPLALDELFVRVAFDAVVVELPMVVLQRLIARYGPDIVVVSVGLVPAC